MKSLIYFCLGVAFASAMWCLITCYEISFYKNYYHSAEKVLDRTYEVYDSFLDTIGETDDYCDYIEARKKIAH